MNYYVAIIILELILLTIRIMFLPPKFPLQPRLLHRLQLIQFQLKHLT